MRTLEQLGWNEFFMQQITEEERQLGLLPARITEVHKEAYKIIYEKNEKSAKLKSSLFYQDSKYITYPCVGDFVLVKENEQGEDLIYRVLDRKSFFGRMDPDMADKTHNAARQMIAANFDYVFIMESLNFDFNVRKMERYLSTAWESGGTPVIILTKADLCDDVDEKISIMEVNAPGVEVIAISAITGFGLEKLEPYLRSGKTLALLGSSGIGKSSLVNALMGEEYMKVSDIRESDSRGRHTTTHRQLIMMESGVMLIDTPGMRELGMWDVLNGITETFQDVEELMLGCKFQNCKHEFEPGCAVKNAIKEGSLDPKRYTSYQKLKREAERSAKKAEMIKAKQISAKKTSSRKLGREEIRSYQYENSDSI